SIEGLKIAVLARFFPIPTFYFTVKYANQGRMIFLTSLLGLTNSYLTVCVLTSAPTGYKLFKPKFHANGTLSRYKARLVANGSSQQPGVDFDETFSPVVKPATIRTVFSLDVSRRWPIHQLDVKNAFLNVDLSETVYMHQPPGFVDSRYPHHVCLLQRSLYGLKQAPRAWFQRCDSSLFIYTQGSQVAYLLIYVDDIILTTSSSVLLRQIIDSLHKEFDMTDLGALNYFLGVSAFRHSTGLFLSQKKYDPQLLERAHMVNCNPSRTPVDTDSKLGPDGVLVQDPTLYRSLAGGLQYLTFTSPDLSYAVQQICLYMHDPREPHFAALKRILRYVLGTLDLGLHLYASATTSLVGYTDADWAGCPSTRRSTGGPAQPVLFAAHQPHGYGTAQQQQQPVQQQHNLHSLPSNSQGILGAAPALHPSQATSLPSAFSTMTLHDPTWNMDTGATSHLNSNAHNLSTLFNSRLYPSIHVGDGNSIPVTNTGHSIIPSLHRPLHLHNVLVTPNIIKNLIYVRQFTRDNNCTIEFDAFGFSVKDFLTRHILLRCDSSGDLYPVTKPSTVPAAFVSTSSSTWHQRLGHPGDDVLRSLSSRHLISCNKERSPHVCHACQLGKHVKLPFHSSISSVKQCFDIIHSDLWTSPIIKMVLRFCKPRPKLSNVNLVRSMWLFKHKFHADGTLSRNKARLVANGSSQQPGVDFDETFSPVVKPATIRTDYQVAYLLIYVDDIILTASSSVLLRQIIDSLHKEFDMTDLGALNYFLGISGVCHSTRLFLSQKKYALQLLERAHMVNCNPSRTLVNTDSKLGLDGVPVHDPTLYRSLAGGLQYLTFTRPDLSYAVQQICLYMHDLREPHFAALKHILRYVQGTLDLGLHLYASATTSLVGYTDADWAGCPSTRRAEAEYRGVANVVAETAWIRNLLRELHSPLLTATLVYCDNVSAVYMSANPVQHQRTKHIEIDIHFVRDMVKAGHVRILHVPSRFQYADIFTKGLPSALFEDFRSSLSVRPPPAQTAGAY
ncbi:ribonuclease H-like domain-containing protein, partial [Tanacetum coccineum]